MTGKLALALWLAACLAVLLFGFVQRDVHDMPVAFTWFLIALGVPLASVATVASGFLMAILSSTLGWQYLPFWHEAPMWFATVAVGYWQWLYLVPRIIRTVRQARSDA